MLVDQIQREQRMPQMIKDPEKQNDIELLAKLVHVIDREFSKFDVQPERVGCEMCLRQISLVEINAKHAIGSAPFHLNAVEAAVATDIEYAVTSQIGGNRVLESFPLHAWEIAEEMFRRRLHAAKGGVMEPFAQPPDLLPHRPAGGRVGLGYFRASAA